MTSYSLTKGKSFENEIKQLLIELQNTHPNRVKIIPQEELSLRDGRTKLIDFGLNYRTLSAQHMVAIECQDRDSWSSEIIDKILSIRSHTYRNRFWFVYRDDRFLSEDVKKLFDSHGILHFSLRELRFHVQLIKDDLAAAEAWIQRMPDGAKHKYDKAPSDPAMSVRR